MWSIILLEKLKKQSISILFLFLLCCSIYAQEKTSIKTIVIDAGHGGKDPGCNGVSFKEKDVSLAVAIKLEAFLKEYLPDVKIIMTRKTDEFVELEERAQIANKNKADLFISIHCNAAGKPIMIKNKKTGKMQPKIYINKKGKKVFVETINPEPFGSETYVMGLKNESGKMQVAMRENSAILLEDNYQQKYQGFDPESEESYIIMSNYTSAYVIQSAKLGMKIQQEYKSKAGRIDKGVHRQSIWVLWRTSMPSVLTEIGYLTNPLEEKFLGSEKGQEYIAACIFNGIRKYKAELEGKKISFDDKIEKLPPLQNENINAGNLPKNINYDEHDTTDKSNTTHPDTTKHTSNDTHLDLKNDSIIFRVQFKVADNYTEIKEDKFLNKIWYYTIGNLYKYTAGYFSRFDDANAYCKTLKDNGYKDSFVVAFKGNERINIEEAKKLTKSKK